MEELTGSKFRYEYVKALYCHPAYVAYMHHANARLDESQAGIMIAGTNISNLRYADITLMAENKELKAF